MLRRTATLPPGAFELLTDPDLLSSLKGNVFKVLVGLAQQAQPTDGAAWAVPPAAAAKDRLAKSLGMAKGTLNDALLKLEERGFIYDEEKVSRGRNLGSAAGGIWLLWTAPLNADGTPWRPGPGSPAPSDTSTDFSPVKLSPVKDWSTNSWSVPVEAPTREPQPVGRQDLVDVHASQEVPKSKNAEGTESTRLLNAQPCPRDLDDALTALGFHGNLTVPESMAIEVEVGDLHDLLLYLLREQEQARATGRTVKLAGVLGKRIKTAKDFHALLLEAGAEGYLARFRQAAETAASVKPDWCGVCDQTSRQREDEASGLPYRCPACHPLRGQSIQSA